jgi:hypothetical protein
LYSYKRRIKREAVASLTFYNDFMRIGFALAIVMSPHYLSSRIDNPTIF